MSDPKRKSGTSGTPAAPSGKAAASAPPPSHTRPLAGLSPMQSAPAGPRTQGAQSLSPMMAAGASAAKKSSPLSPAPGPAPAASTSLSPMASGSPKSASPKGAGAKPSAQPAAPKSGKPMPAVQAQAAAAPARQIPDTIDGRPAVQAGTASDGRRVFAPLRDPSDPSKGVSPFPHYSEGLGGASGHLSDLSVHTAAAAPATIVRMQQTYTAPKGGKPPASRSDRYADSATGQQQRLKAEKFSVDPKAPPLSPRTLTNAAARTKITFKAEAPEKKGDE